MLETASAAFATLFVLIDPIGVAPLFVALTAGMDAPARRRVALRGALVAFAILALFGLAGEALLATIGVGLPAFRIAGGLMLFLLAIDMLFENRSARREKTAGAGGADPSVFPLATPLIAGPGAMAAMILLVAGQRGDPLGQAAVFAAMAAVLAICVALCFAGAAIERLLGRTGVMVMTRLFGMLLGALAVQFVLDGIAAAEFS